MTYANYSHLASSNAHYPSLSSLSSFVLISRSNNSRLLKYFTHFTISTTTSAIIAEQKSKDISVKIIQRTSLSLLLYHSAVYLGESILHFGKNGISLYNWRCSNYATGFTFVNEAAKWAN
jgi:hypothetical protein